jgi:hypothetical protein
VSKIRSVSRPPLKSHGVLNLLMCLVVVIFLGQVMISRGSYVRNYSRIICEELLEDHM